MARPIHRTPTFERVVNKLADRINSGIDTLAMGYLGGSDRPPFTHELSKQEQMQQYLAMDEQKWTALSMQQGVIATREYSEAMQKLAHEMFGAGIGVAMLPPENRVADMEQAFSLAGNPRMQPAPDPQPIDFANMQAMNEPAGGPLTPMNMPQAPSPDDPRVQEIVRNALGQGVG